MQYQVPQFLEVEDRIVGPFTFKQFMYMAGGAGFGFITYTSLPFMLFVLIGIPLVAFFFSLAFLKPGGKPFIYTVENFIQFVFGSKLYMWRKEKKTKAVKNKEDLQNTPLVGVPKMSDSKLRELTWGLDIHETLSDQNHSDEVKSEFDFKV